MTFSGGNSHSIENKNIQQQPNEEKQQALLVLAQLAKEGDFDRLDTNSGFSYNGKPVELSGSKKGGVSFGADDDTTYVFDVNEKTFVADDAGRTKLSLDRISLSQKLVKSIEQAKEFDEMIDNVDMKDGVSGRETTFIVAFLKTMDDVSKSDDPYDLFEKASRDLSGADFETSAGLVAAAIVEQSMLQKVHKKANEDTYKKYALGFLKKHKKEVGGSMQDELNTTRNPQNGSENSSGLNQNREDAGEVDTLDRVSLAGTRDYLRTHHSDDFYIAERYVQRKIDGKISSAQDDMMQLTETTSVPDVLKRFGLYPSNVPTKPSTKPPSSNTFTTKINNTKPINNAPEVVTMAEGLSTEHKAHFDNVHGKGKWSLVDKKHQNPDYVTILVDGKELNYTLSGINQKLANMNNETMDEDGDDTATAEHRHTAGKTYQNKLDRRTLRKTKAHKADRKALKLQLDLEGDDVIDSFSDEYESIFGKSLRRGEKAMARMIWNTLGKRNRKFNAVSAIHALDRFALGYNVPLSNGNPDYTKFVDLFLAKGLGNYLPQQKKKRGKIHNNEMKFLRKFTQAYCYSVARRKYKDDSGEYVYGKFYASETFRNDLKPVFNMLRAGQSELGTGIRGIKTAENIDVNEVAEQHGDKLLDYIGGFLGDANVDGELSYTNLSLTGRAQESYNKKHNPDVMGVSGSAVAQAMIDAKRDMIGFQKLSPEQAEEKLVQGVVKLIEGAVKNYGPHLKGRIDQQENVLQNITTEKQLLSFLKEQPHLKAVFQDMIKGHGEEVYTMLAEGPDYVYRVVERWKRADKITTMEDEGTYGGMDIFSDTDASALTEVLTEDQHEKIDQFLNKEYAKYLSDLRNAILDAKNSGKYNPEDIAQLEASYQSQQDPSAIKDNIKLWKHNFAGVGVSLIEGRKGAGLAGNSSLSLKNLAEKHPNAITKALDKAFTSFNVTPGIMGIMAGGKLRPVVGVAVSLAARKQLNKKTHILYGVGVGAGVDMERGRLIVGPSLNLGIERQLGSASLSKSLDAKSSQYVGAMLHSTLLHHGASIYRRRDKLEGLTQQRASIKEGFADIVGSIINKPTMTVREIEAALQKKYPGSKGEGISTMAADISQLLSQYNNTLLQKVSADTRTRSFAKIKEIIADTMATRFWNENIADIAAGSYHVSGAGLGVMLVSGYFPIPSIGLKITDYKTPTYREYAESLKRGEEVFGKGLGRKKLDISSKDFAKGLNERFGLQNGISFEKYGNPAVDVLAFSPDVLTALKMHVTPELKQFMTLDAQGRLIIPSTMMMDLQRRGHAEHVEYHLILGNIGTMRYQDQSLYENDPSKPTKGLSHIEAVTDFAAFANHKGNPAAYKDTVTTGPQFVDVISQNTFEQALDGLSLPTEFTQQLKYTVGERGGLTLVYGGKEITHNTNTGTLTFVKNTNTSKMSIEFTDTDKPLKLLYQTEKEKIVYDTKTINFAEKMGVQGIEKTGYLDTDVKKIDAFVSKYKWGLIRSKAFMNAAENGDRDKARAALKKLPGFANADDYNRADISNLFANISRVPSTKYKQLDISTQESVIDDLGTKSKINSKNRDLLKAIARRDYDYDPQKKRQLIEQILGVKLNSDGFGNTASPTRMKYQLAWMLADMTDVVNARTDRYKRRLNRESLLKGDVKTLMEWRKASTATLQGSMCPNPQPQNSSFGAVARYAGVGIDEKHVIAPRLACDPMSLSSMGFSDTQEKAMRTYFMENFEKQSPGLLQQMMQPLADTYGAIMDREEFVDQVVDKGFYEDQNGVRITPTFQFGWYAHCINETLLITFEDAVTQVESGSTTQRTLEKDVDVDTTKIKVAEATGNIGINNYDTLLEAQTRDSTIGIGVAAGKKRKVENEEIEEKKRGGSTPHKDTEEKKKGRSTPHKDTPKKNNDTPTPKKNNDTPL